MYILVRVGDHIAQPIIKSTSPATNFCDTVNTDKEANNMSQALERIIGKLRYIDVLIPYTYRNTGISIHRYVVLW